MLVVLGCVYLTEYTSQLHSTSCLGEFFRFHLASSSTSGLVVQVDRFVIVDTQQLNVGVKGQKSRRPYRLNHGPSSYNCSGPRPCKESQQGKRFNRETFSILIYNASMAEVLSRVVSCGGEILKVEAPGLPMVTAVSYISSSLMAMRIVSCADTGDEDGVPRDPGSLEHAVRLL